MKLGKLIKIQESGALKAGDSCSVGNITVGGVPLTSEQCDAFVKNLGWLKYEKQSWEIVDKTNKFIRSIKGYIDKENILNETEITFENSRRQNTEKYLDRIKMVNGHFDITILYGAHGVGGTYAVYDGRNTFSQPMFRCRTAKQLGEYINSLA